MKLCNVPYTDDGQLVATWFSTAKKGIRLLSKSLAITNAGDHGALTVWWGNDGLWHANKHRFSVTVEDLYFSKKADILPWLEKTMKDIGL